MGYLYMGGGLELINRLFSSCGVALETTATLNGTHPHPKYSIHRIVDRKYVQKCSGHVLRTALRVTRRFFRDMVPLVGNGCLSHMEWVTLSFIFFIGTAMFGLTFGRCKTAKLLMYFLPGLLSLKSDVLVTQSKMAQPKSRNKVSYIL